MSSKYAVNTVFAGVHFLAEVLDKKINQAKTGLAQWRLLNGIRRITGISCHYWMYKTDEQDWFIIDFLPLSRLFLCIATCSVEVYECLAADVIVETLAAVLFQLNLFDGHIFSHHLVPLFPSKEAVSKHAIYCDWQTLLSDLVSSLKQENTIQKNLIKNRTWKHAPTYYVIKRHVL